MAGLTTAAVPSDIVEALAPLLAQQRRRWADRCRAHGLSILAFDALALIEMREPLTMSKFADELGLALPNATGVVNRMEERGLVRRRDDPADRRLVRVELTDAGHRLIEEIEATRRERMTRLFAELDDEQRERVLIAVKDLGAAAERLARTPSTAGDSP
jgi:DNA-binding MarR family transcriptional regulator